MSGDCGSYTGTCSYCGEWSDTWCDGAINAIKAEERNRIADALEKTADNTRDVEASNVLMLMGRGAVEKAFREFAERLRKGEV